MKKKIVHLAYSLGYGGLEQVIVNLINNSTDYNCQHIIITLSNSQDLYGRIKPNVPIYSLDKRPGNDLLSHWRLFKLFRKLSPDVLHTYNFSTLEYHLIARLAGVKIQVHCEHGRSDDPDGTKLSHKILRQFSAKLMDNYIVVSPDLFDWGKNVLNLSDNKLQLLYNGIDLTQYFPSKEPRPLSATYTICTVGRADPVKNQKLLIDAYRLVRDQHPDISDSQLQIIGGGPILSELKQYVASLNLNSHIHLLGFRDNVADFMRKTNLFILSSTYEAMPLTILEALSCGLPVIATDVGGVSHLLSDNEGWLVPTKNVQQLAKQIYEVFKNPELANKKAQKGKEMVEQQYSIENMVSEYMLLYKCKKNK